MHRSVRRRRLEMRTDYKSRLALLKSGKPRLVVRKTNRYLIAQIVESDVAQDKVIAGITSKYLLQKGWPEEKSGSLKSLAASYLTGFALGKIASSKLKEKTLILDIGMNRNIQKSRIYAVLKGLIDSGFKIPHSPDSLPTKEGTESNKSLIPVMEKVKKELA